MGRVGPTTAAPTLLYHSTAGTLQTTLQSSYVESSLPLQLLLIDRQNLMKTALLHPKCITYYQPGLVECWSGGVAEWLSGGQGSTSHLEKTVSLHIQHFKQEYI